MKRAIVLMALTLLVLSGCTNERTPPATGAQAQQPVAENSLGRDVYVRTCATCHGPDGEGYANQLKAPALDPTEHAWHHPDGQIQRLIRDGGGVVVQYNCPDGCDVLVAQLSEIVARYSEQVILAPYPDMDSAIALTAWGRIDTFDGFDQERIERFIRAYRGIDHHRG